MTVDVVPLPRAGARRSEGLEELWRYRELFYFLAWRDVKIRYKQTVLGVGWALLQPLLTMLVFTLLFGRLGNMPSDGIPYPIFYFAALLPWTYFATTLANAGNSLVLNANLLTKVYFPRIILPSASAVSGLVDLGVGSILLGGLMAYYGLEPTWKLLLLIPLVGLLFLVTLAVGMVLAALNVKYRDVKYTLPFLVQFWLFVTPVIYPVSLVPERYRLLVALNPLSGVINGFRASLVPTAEVYWPLVGASALVTAVLLIVAVRYFINTERSFADIV